MGLGNVASVHDVTGRNLAVCVGIGKEAEDIQLDLAQIVGFHKGVELLFRHFFK